MESGDSDNEILATFKPEANAPAQKQQFIPPYLQNQNNHNIDDNTGFTNSPKFSIYRLNNQSSLNNGATSDFNDQKAINNQLTSS